MGEHASAGLQRNSPVGQGSDEDVQLQRPSCLAVVYSDFGIAWVNPSPSNGYHKKGYWL